MCVGSLLQVLNASTNLPHKVAFAQDKVVEQRCVFLSPAHFIIENAPTMLSLETLFDFTTTS
jgi:hypothetical protein